MYANESHFQGTRYREPIYLEGSNYDDNTTYGNLFNPDNYQKFYNTMVQSVAKYGGYFVSRYETSINDSTQGSRISLYIK